jgi:hypothetical protein
MELKSFFDRPQPNYEEMEPYYAAPVSGAQITPSVTVGQVARSSISRIKDPVTAMFQYNHGAPRQEFDEEKYSNPIYAPILDDLRMMPSEKERQVKADLYVKDLADRQVFQRATLVQSLAGSVLNPVYAVPFFRISQGATLLGTAANAALAGGGITAVEEVARYSQLPGYDPMEGAFNVAAATGLSLALGAGIYGAKSGLKDAVNSAHRRLGMHQQTILEMENFVEREQLLKDMVRGSRPFGIQTTEYLRAKSIQLTQQIQGKTQTLNRINNGQLNLSPTAAATIRDEIAQITAERAGILDELNVRRFDEGLSNIEDPYGLATSFFDKLDIMPTPIKTITRFKLPSNAQPSAKEALNKFKRTSLLLAGDSSLLYAGQKLGLTLPPSVEINTKLRRGNLIQMESELSKVWAKATDAGFGASITRRLPIGGQSLDDWVNNVNIKRIQQDPNMTPLELEAAEIIRRYTDGLRDEALQYDVMGSRAFLQSRQTVLEGHLQYAREKYTQASDPQRLARFPEQAEYWQGRVRELEANVAEIENSLRYVTENNFRPTGSDEPWFIRQWDQDKVSADEKGPKLLRQKLTNYIRQNPYGVEYDNASGLYKPRDLTGDIAAQDRYVDTVIKSILSDSDASSSATSRSNRYPSRAINIPNSEVLEFMNLNFRDMMRTYTMRIGPKIEFSKQFGNRSYNDVADELVDDLVSSGVRLDDALELRRNLTTLYQRVTATTLSDPSSLSNRSVQVLKDITTMNYLQGAGVTTMGDIPKVIMEHGLKNVGKGLMATFDSKAFQKQFKEIKEVFGEAAELSLGTTQQALIEDTGARISSGGVWTGIKNASFVLNGLGPATVGLKMLSGNLSVHSFIDTAARVADGTASKFELERASRYGLSIKQLKEIAARAPTEKTAKGLNLANISEWTNAGVSSETIAAFRAAVSQQTANTILSSSPATRFTYADGSIFMKMKYAQKIYPSIQEDPDFKGYARIESGVMTLPFMFYNWSMSATTNILQSSAQGQIKSRYAGFATMIGFGYLLAKIRTPEWAWNEMDADEKFAAAIERSGIGAVYSDIALNSIRLGVQTGLNDPDNDIANLPFYGKDGYAEAATTVLGAGAGTIKDFSDVVSNAYQEEYGQALKEFYLMLPFTELFWLKEDSRAMIDYATRNAFDAR